MFDLSLFRSITFSYYKYMCVYISMCVCGPGVCELSLSLSKMLHFEEREREREYKNGGCRMWDSWWGTYGPVSGDNVGGDRLRLSVVREVTGCSRFFFATRYGQDLPVYLKCPKLFSLNNGNCRSVDDWDRFTSEVELLLDRSMGWRCCGPGFFKILLDLAGASCGTRGSCDVHFYFHRINCSLKAFTFSSMNVYYRWVDWFEIKYLH